MSLTLFGMSGSKARKNIYGYIDLTKKFLHPVAYNALTSVKRSFINVINGSSYFKVDDKGELIEDNKNGETGIDFLYKNWEKFNFKKGGSIRNNRINILKLPKKLLFVDKWLVIPAYYRDVDLSKKGVKSVDEINTHYRNLINLSAANDSMFSYMSHITEYRIQTELNLIYEYLTGYLSGKEGLIKQDLMGKTVDYSTRGVISATRINSNKWNEQNVPFGYTGIPLSHLCNLFYPFFIYHIKGYLEEIFTTINSIPDENGRPVKVKDPMNDYSADALKNMINLFITTPNRRFDPLIFNTEEGPKKLYLYKNDLGRVFTVLDLLFLVATRVIEDKHVYVTRYPVENFANIYPSKIKILTTYKTKDMVINSKHFQEYPVYDGKAPIDDIRFIDTIVLSPSMLSALGADYDGWKSSYIF